MQVHEMRNFGNAAFAKLCAGKSPKLKQETEQAAPSGRPVGVVGSESPSTLAGIDQEFLAGGALVVDVDIGEIERLLQRHHLGVVAGEGGLEFGGDALAQ